MLSIWAKIASPACSRTVTPSNPPSRRMSSRSGSLVSVGRMFPIGSQNRAAARAPYLNSASAASRKAARVASR